MDNKSVFALMVLCLILGFSIGFMIDYDTPPADSQDIKITPNYGIWGWESVNGSVEYNPNDVAITVEGKDIYFDFYNDYEDSEDKTVPETPGNTTYMNPGYVIQMTGEKIGGATNYDLYYNQEKVFNFWILEDG